jgi:hypothetical protein
MERLVDHSYYLSVNHQVDPYTRSFQYFNSKRRFKGKDSYLEMQKEFFIIFLLVLILLIWKYSWKIQLLYNRSIMSIYTPDSFPIRCGRSEIIKNDLGKGRVIASQSGIVIVGLLRDVSSLTDMIRKKVEHIGSYFKRYIVILVENDSNDDTRKKLLNWVDENPRVTLLGCGINVRECSIPASSEKTIGHMVDRKRISKMVNLRNIYLKYLKESIDPDLYRFTAVWDLDLIGSLYADGLFDSVYQLEKNRGLSAICANGLYRWLGFWPIEHDLVKGLTKGLYLRGDPLLPVQSCFSGFTLYKTKDLILKNVIYSMTPSKSNIECEHVRLHSTLPGKIVMNPNMIHLILLNR